MYKNIKYNKEIAKEFNKENLKKNRNEHIINNIPLAVSIVNKFNIYNNSYYDKEDLIQLSLEGLIKSMDSFDFDSGYSLSTYASIYCQGAILKFLRDGNFIKTPRSIVDLNSKLNRYLNQGYTDEEIKELMGSDYEEVITYRKLTNLTSLDVVFLTSDGDDVSLYDMIIDGADMEKQVCLSETIKQALNTLEEKERNVIILRFFEDKKQMEVSFILGISQVQVSRIEKKALNKLKIELTKQ